MVKVPLLLVLLAPLLASAVALAEEGGHGPDSVEWGEVQWLRDFEAAEAEARVSGKPILLLFQEVPG